jgi:hypothetical protein
MWPEVAAWLLLLVCADAKERELFHQSGVPEPTYFGFLTYLLLTAGSLALFADLHPDHQLHSIQLSMLCASWVTFWIVHWERISILLAAGAATVCLGMIVITSEAWLLVWMTYLGIHTFSLWSFRRRSQGVRFPGRPISRFRTSVDSLSEGAGANAYLLPVPNGILSIQPINSK